MSDRRNVAEQRGITTLLERTGDLSGGAKVANSRSTDL